MSNLDGNKHDLIERYLLERLSIEEKEQFTQLMKDPEFQKEVDFKKDILESIEFQEDTRLKSMLQEEEKAIKLTEQKKSVKTFSIRRVAAVAASVLFLVFIYWQFFTPKEDLFAEYFVRQTNTLYPTVKSAKNPTEVEQTFNFYESADYEKALLGFEKILSEQDNDNIAFYQAVSFLANEETEKAITTLQKIIQNNQTDYLAPTKWNLALAYISQNKFAAAKPLLEELAADRFHKEKAGKLLNEAVFQELK